MNFFYPPSHARAEVRTSFREWTFFRVLSYPKSPSPLPLSAWGPLQLTADLCRVLVLWMAPSTSSGWVLRSSSSTQPSWASGGGKQAQLTAPTIPRRGCSGCVRAGVLDLPRCGGRGPEQQPRKPRARPALGQVADRRGGSVAEHGPRELVGECVPALYPLVLVLQAVKPVLQALSLGIDAQNHATCRGEPGAAGILDL